MCFYLLHTETRPTALGEREHAPLSVRRPELGALAPSVRGEAVRVREDALVVVHDGARHAHGVAAGNDQVEGLLVPLSVVEQILLGCDAGSAGGDAVRETEAFLDDRLEEGEFLTNSRFMVSSCINTVACPIPIYYLAARGSCYCIPLFWAI